MQGDKTRRNRPFGSFMLFLSILVVVLVLFGSDQLRKRQEFTQDEFEWQLYTGQVDELLFKGDNVIEGTLASKELFRVSFASVTERQDLYRELNATA